MCWFVIFDIVDWGIAVGKPQHYYYVFGCTSSIFLFVFFFQNKDMYRTEQTVKFFASRVTTETSMKLPTKYYKFPRWRFINNNIGVGGGSRHLLLLGHQHSISHEILPEHYSLSLYEFIGDNSLSQKRGEPSSRICLLVHH